MCRKVSARKMTALFLIIAMFIVQTVLFSPRAEAAVQAIYYVSSAGSDSTGDGSCENPWATIQKARDVIRGLTKTGTIIVNLEPGEYYQTSTIEFNSDDSGLDSNNPVIYRTDPNYPLGSAHINGGSVIDQNSWTVYSGNIYRTYVGIGWESYDLYENGVRAVRARYPNINAGWGVTTTAQSEYLFTDVQEQSKFQITYKAGDLDPASWSGDPDKLQVYVWPGWYSYPDLNGCWWTDLMPIVSVDPNSRVISFGNKQMNFTCNGGERYYIQNDLSLLDAPGEYYLDSSEGYLYYYPRNGVISSQEIIIPRTKDLIKLTGASEASPAHDISFEGLTIEYSDFSSYAIAFDEDEEADPNNVPTANGKSFQHGLIVSNNVRNMTVENCHLRNSGFQGIYMKLYNMNNRIYGNWIENTGMHGILADGYLNTYTGGARTDTNRDNTISNNKIQWAGMKIGQGNGICLYFSGHNTISYNYVEHTPMNGILFSSNRFGEGPFYNANNIIEYNDISYCAEDAGDGAGGIYSWGWITEEDYNTVRQNSVRHMLADPSMNDTPPHGVYSDIYSDYTVYENNYIEDIQDGYLIANGTNLVLTNNSFDPNFDESQIDFVNIGLKSEFPSEYGGRYPRQGITTVNDNDTGSGYSQFNYGGNWSYGGGKTNQLRPDSYMMDCHSSSDANDYYTVKFYGTQIKLYTEMDSDDGIATISIDDGAGVDVDLYNPYRRNMALVYTSPEMPLDCHYLKVKVKGTKNALSTGYRIAADKVDIINNGGMVNDDGGNGISYIRGNGYWYISDARGYGDYCDDIQYADGSTSYFQYTFTGNGIDYITEKDADMGNVDIYIDNIFQQTVDCYSATRIVQQTVYSNTGLTEGSHTLKVVNNGSPKMRLDALKIYGANGGRIINNDGRNLKYGGPGTWFVSDARYYDDYNHDLSTTGNKDDYVECTFIGTGVDFITEKADTDGNVDIYIDGIYDTTVDCYSATRLVQQTIYSKSGLSPGMHTIKVVAKDASKNLFVDAFKIYNSGAPANMANSSKIFINDDNPYIKFNSDGEWHDTNGRGLGDYNDDVHYTTIDGDYVSYTFNGTGIAYVTEMSDEVHRMEVYIDDVQMTITNLYNPLFLLRSYVAYKKTDLALGWHTIKVKKVLANLWHLKGTVDGFVVYGSPDPVLPAPTSQMSVVNDDGGITYSGTWTDANSRGVGNYGDDTHYTSANGDYLTYTFTGNGFDFVTEKGSDRGDADVYIDGIYQATISCYDPNYFTPQQTVYSKADLSYGSHTLKVEKKSGTYLALDCIKIYNNTWMVNDDDRNITYSENGVYKFGNYNDRGLGDYNDDLHAKFSVNDYYEYTFNGNGIELIAPKSPWSGTNDIYIDNVFKQTVDCSNATYIPQQVIYSNMSLDSNTHTVKVVNKIQSMGIYIDAFKLYRYGTVQMVDDDDPNIVYTGLWTDRNWGQGDYNSNTHYQGVNSSFMYTFIGTGIEYVTPYASTNGTHDIFIDGVYQTSVSTYAPSYMPQRVAYSISSLPYGTHTIKIEENVAGIIYLDALRIYK